MNEYEDQDRETLVEPENSIPGVRLEEMPEAIRAAAARMGWEALMPVQARAIPYVLAGRDLMVQSHTGSGKTGAFCLPILHKLDPDKAVCQALILVPTRELARQVAADAEAMAAGTGVRVVAVYGGAGYGAQLEAFRKGAHLVVGTPGRVLDHLLRRSLSLGDLDFLVFDEADRMLSIGFYPDMKAIQRYLPKKVVNVLMFSATFPPHVMRLAGEFMREPDLLSLSGDQVHVADTLHIFAEIPGMDKDRALMRFIEVENPSQAIIFCNTKANVHYVTAVLQGFGYEADELSADLSQSRRDEVLARVRSGRMRFLVATDVAARGIDIPDLSHVFIYDLPEDQETYIHRAGRTGRAGASGTIISLCDVMETLTIKRIAAKYKINIIKRQAPTDEDVAAAIGQRLTARLEMRLREKDSLKRERIQRLTPLVRTLAQGEDDVELLAMLLDGVYQESIESIAPSPTGERLESRPESRSGQRSGTQRDERRRERSRSRGGDRYRDEERPRERFASEEGAGPVEQPAGEEARAEGDQPARKRKRRRRKKPGGGGSSPAAAGEADA